MPMKTAKSYYVVKIKGHQYHVKTGDIIEVEKVNGKKGDKIDIKEILLKKNAKGKVEIGKPYVKNAKMKIEIIDQIKEPKIEIVKFKKKNRYLKRQGHRQLKTKIKIL